MITVSVVIPAYNDGERAVSAAQAMLSQALPDGTTLEIILVDDGSSDQTGVQLSRLAGANLHVLSLPSNQGRSRARNAGAKVARGDVIVFVDCDCTPGSDAFLSAHAAAILGGCVASTGHVTGFDGGFWDRYQRDSSSRRAQLHAKGARFAGTSSNLAVLRSAYLRSGGFDERYRGYGFEDRDLLIRLNALGDIAWVDAATVRHLDDLSLAAVGRKMFEAGQHGSLVFQRQHPVAYESLGYAALDARLRPWLRWLAWIVGPWLGRAAPLIDPLLHRRWLPNSFGRGVVKAMTAAFFLCGTAKESLD